MSLTQPAFSQNLRALERHFGSPMLNRTGRGVALTEAARLVVDYARRTLRLVEESDAAVRDLLGLGRGSLAIGASTTPGTYLLPRLLGKFRARYPDVALRLRIGDTRQVEDWVLRGEVDFGVIGETTEQLGLTVRPFRRDELVLVAPYDHALATRPLDAATLAATPLILRERGSSTRETFERALAREGHVPAVLFELGSTEAIVRAVAAGLGASVVSRLAVEGSQRHATLRVRRVSSLDLTRHFAIAVHPDARPSPAAERFLATLAPAEAGGRQS